MNVDYRAANVYDIESKYRDALTILFQQLCGEVHKGTA